MQNGTVRARQLTQQECKPTHYFHVGRQHWSSIVKLTVDLLFVVLRVSNQRAAGAGFLADLPDDGRRLAAARRADDDAIS